MDIAPIRQYLQGSLEQVEASMEAALDSGIALLDQTNRQLQEHPGKRVRAMLALLAAGACGQVNPDSIRCAAAAELMHNASLLHDDVVDGAAERRGMPTVAHLLGGGPAVLVGDYWLVNCVKTLLSVSREPLRMVEIFSETLGHLAEGELLQLEKAGRGDTSQADYERIIFSKTASLFRAAAVSAAVSVRAPEAWVEAVGNYARNLGMAFQVKDDIFDYSVPSQGLGKPVGTDLREQKITQPLLSALEEVSEEEAAAVRALVARVPDSPEAEESIRRFVAEKGGVERAGLVMDAFIDQSLGHLAVLPDSPEKEYLRQLAFYVGRRSR